MHRQKRTPKTTRFGAVLRTGNFSHHFGQRPLLEQRRKPVFQPQADFDSCVLIRNSRTATLSLVLQPHTTKSLRTVPTRILSVVTKNQNPGLVAIAYNHDCFRIEIAEINSDVLWLLARLPPKNSGWLCVGFESINEIPGDDQETICPANHIAYAQPVEIEEHWIAEFGAGTFLNHFCGVKQRNEQCIFASAFRISKSDPQLAMIGSKRFNI